MRWFGATRRALSLSEAFPEILPSAPGLLQCDGHATALNVPDQLDLVAAFINEAIEPILLFN